MEKIRVGIVGTGYTVGIADNHAKGYLQNPGCVLTAVYDIVPGRAAQWAKEKNLEVEICSDYDELLEKVDAVSICLPTMLMESWLCGLWKKESICCVKSL